jgi:hypothetical protein
MPWDTYGTGPAKKEGAGNPHLHRLLRLFGD